MFFKKVAFFHTIFTILVNAEACSVQYHYVLCSNCRISVHFVYIRQKALLTLNLVSGTMKIDRYAAIQIGQMRELTIAFFATTPGWIFY
jgi:hypothetical protein